MRAIVAVAASCATIATVDAAELPFRLASSTEIAALSQAGVIATPLNQTNFKTAATVTVHKFSESSLSPSRTQRAANAASGAYKAAIAAGTDPNQHFIPPVDYTTDVVEPEHNQDSVQAWAFMSELGTPYVRVNADGKSRGQSAASWSTQYTVPGSGNRDVYVQFTVPSVSTWGRFEDSAPSLYWGRLRIDFLVNAYPAWSTEVVRFNETYPNPQPPHNTVEKQYRVDTFGYSIGVNKTTPNAPSTSHVVTLKLGTYVGSTVLDFTELFQAEGKVESECNIELADPECGGVVVKMEWQPSAPPPTFYSKAAS